MIEIHFVETTSGNDFFVVNKGSQPIMPDSPDDPIVAIHELDMTEDEFATLANQAMTHKLKYDTVTSTVVAIPIDTTQTPNDGTSIGV